MDFKIWFENDEKVPVQAVQQNYEYDCGAAVLKSIAGFYGVGPKDEQDFIRLCRTSQKDGTQSTDIVRAARRLGLKAQIIENMHLDQLKSLLDQHIPVICAIQAWGDEDEYDNLEDSHYVIAIGYEDGDIVFEDPYITKSRGYLPEQEFVERWKEKDSDHNEAQIGIGIPVMGVPKHPDHVEKKTKIQ